MAVYEGKGENGYKGSKQAKRLDGITLVEKAVMFHIEGLKNF